MKKKLLILTGAGISKESGVDTFRCVDGIWTNNKSLEELLTYSGWMSDRELLLELHGKLYEQILNAKPNLAHLSLVKLEEEYDVTIITQNVDDLHERSGSSNVIHLHGNIKQSKSTVNPSLVYNIKDEDGYIKIGDKCEKGSQLRPNVIWFGENVYHLDKLSDNYVDSDIMVVIGTSLQVYPFAFCVDFFKQKEKVFIIDPNDIIDVKSYKNMVHIKENATTGVEKLVSILLR